MIPSFTAESEHQLAEAQAQVAASAFLSHVHHAYAQTDGTYAWPNSREGDMLRQAKREIEALMAQNDQIQPRHD